MSWFNAIQSACNSWNDLSHTSEPGMSLPPAGLDTKKRVKATQRLETEESEGINSSKWTEEEDQRLLKLAEDLGTDWPAISQHFTDKSEIDLQQRWNLKFNWTPDEDQVLKDLYNNHGPCWTMIASHLKPKNARDVESRYLQILNNSSESLEPSDDDEMKKEIKRVFGKMCEIESFIAKTKSQIKPLIKNKKH